MTNEKKAKYKIGTLDQSIDHKNIVKSILFFGYSFLRHKKPHSLFSALKPSKEKIRKMPFKTHCCLRHVYNADTRYVLFYENVSQNIKQTCVYVCVCA